MEHLIADAECRLLLLEALCSRRGGAAVSSPTGVLRPMAASTGQYDPIRFAFMALGHIDQSEGPSSV